MNFYNELERVKSEVDAGKSSALARHLVRESFGYVTTQGDHGEMWNTACQSLRYVLDVAVNQGTSEDLRELREALDSDSDYSAQPGVDQSIRLIGQLYQHNYSPDMDLFAGDGDLPLDAVVGAWNYEIGQAAMYAVLSHMEDWENDNEAEDNA